jgi:acetyltransferase-like isoleucine patch superfamily enzyme
MLEYLWSKIIKKARGASIKKSKIHSSSKVESGSSFFNSTMDRHSFCGYDCEIANADIGPFCSIADHVAIGGGRHPIEWVGTSPVFYAGRDSVRKKFAEFSRPDPLRVSIGADVWIGYRAIVMQGVTIGPGAVIGAGAVVTRDVAPYAMVGGVPARRFSDRFDQKLQKALLASRWWERSDEELAHASLYIRDPERFLQELGSCA